MQFYIQFFILEICLGTAYSVQDNVFIIPGGATIDLRAADTYAVHDDRQANRNAEEMQRTSKMIILKLQHLTHAVLAMEISHLEFLALAALLYWSTGSSSAQQKIGRRMRRRT